MKFLKIDIAKSLKVEELPSSEYFFKYLHCLPLKEISLSALNPIYLKGRYLSLSYS